MKDSIVTSYPSMILLFWNILMASETSRVTSSVMAWSAPAFFEKYLNTVFNCCSYSSNTGYPILKFFYIRYLDKGKVGLTSSSAVFALFFPALGLRWFSNR